VFSAFGCWRIGGGCPRQPDFLLFVPASRTQVRNWRFQSVVNETITGAITGQETALIGLSVNAEENLEQRRHGECSCGNVYEVIARIAFQLSG